MISRLCRGSQEGYPHSGNSEALEFNIGIFGPDTLQNIPQAFISSPAEEVGLFTFKAKLDEADGKMGGFNDGNFLCRGLDYSSETR